MKKMLLTVALAFLGAGAGCARQVDLEKVPLGTNVDVTREDGGVVRGTLAGRDEKTVKITTGSTTRAVPRDQIVAMQSADDMPAELPPVARFREFTLPAGTRLEVRLNSPVGSESSHAGDPVEATLTTPVIVDGTEVLPAGSVVRGRVEAARSSGKVKGRGDLTLRFDSVSVAGSEERDPIAARASFLAPSGKKRDIAMIGIPAAGGALIGALIGGGKGAAIGAGIGGGAGTGVALSTRGPQVVLPSGSLLALPLDQAIDVRVPITKS
ncbi:MAG: hypothetical protein NTY02_05080 [Acidobacteria bacterium]|nr:hypothetical protein [Acidobacteriota bacterium]